MIIETKQSKIVFPGDLNDQHTLFGGNAMKWMDEVAYFEATRFAKKKMITVSVEKIQFLLPIKSGSIIYIIAKVTKVRSLKIEIQVEIYLEDTISGKQQVATRALFIFAALNKKNHPIPFMSVDLIAE
jgi:acyl-CoA hydrolase